MHFIQLKPFFFTNCMIEIMPTWLRYSFGASIIWVYYHDLNRFFLCTMSLKQGHGEHRSSKQNKTNSKDLYREMSSWQIAVSNSYMELYTFFFLAKRNILFFLKKKRSIFHKYIKMKYQIIPDQDHIRRIVLSYHYTCF